MRLLIDLGHSFMIDSERLKFILMYTKLSYGFLYGLNVFFVKSKKISTKSSVFGLTSTVTDSLHCLNTSFICFSFFQLENQRDCKQFPKRQLNKPLLLCFNYSL